MQYFVYENWRVTEKRAMIHKGICGFCNNGTGMHPKTRKNNGKWHGPFDSYEIAKNFAQSLIDRKVKDCSYCKNWKEDS